MVHPIVLVILLCQLLLISFAIYLIFSFINKTPFYPSSIKQLNLLKESGLLDFKKYKTFIDIGSGDGRIVRWASKIGFKDAHGIEYNPYLSLYSKVRSPFAKGITIHNKRFENHDFSKYDVAYLYIFPEHMENIKEKLFTQMKPGSVIITNTFKFKDITPSDTFEKLYLYFVS